MTGTATKSAAQDNARLAIVGGLGLPAVLSLLVLVGARWALPPEFQADADDPVLHTFFGCAGLPFTAGAAYTLITHPIAARGKRILAWLWLGLAVTSASYSFGGWRLMKAPAVQRSSWGPGALPYDKPRSGGTGFAPRLASLSSAAMPPASETRSFA